MKSKSNLALGAIFLSSLFWSAVAPFMKILYQVFDPFPLAFIRFGIAFLLILPFFLRQPIPKISKIVVFTILISSGNIFFFYLGIAKTTAISSTMIYAATPFIVAILSRFLIKEKLAAHKITGIILGFFGVALIVMLPSLVKGETNLGDLSGNLMVALAVCFWSLYTVGSRYLTDVKKYSSLSLSALSFMSSAVIFGILTAIFPHRNLIMPLTQFKYFLLVIYVAVFATVVTFLLYQWAIKHSSAVTASLGNYLQPVFTIALSMALIGEKLTWGFVIGSFLVMTGLVIFSSKKIFSLIYKKFQFQQLISKY